MTLLKFNGNITPREIFAQNEHKLCSILLDKILENYQDPTKDEIEVFSIEINCCTHTMSISRDMYIPALKNALGVFERTEEYEKCKQCLDIVSELSEKHQH